MLARPAAFVGGFMSGNPGPRPMLDQRGIAANTTVGAATLGVADICQGILNRTGPVAGFVDTWPDADTIIAALDNPQKGDSWFFIYKNGVAQAMTFAAGVGIVSGVGTLSVAASLTRLYMFTLLATKRTTIIVGNTNTNTILTGFDNFELALIEPGMGVTGTNIAASSVVVGVTPSDTPNGATVTLNNATTGTAINLAFTFFPRIQLDSPGSMAA